MKFTITSFLSLFLVFTAQSQNNIVFNTGDNWIGYMNVFELPANGGGYQFGSSWGLADLKSTADSASNTLTLQPNYNTYADNPGDVYWIDTANQVGNKQMEASTFVESDSAFNGQDLSFTGDVLSNTLDSNYEAKFFIKALDPNNGYQDAFAGAKTFDLPASGSFTVSALASELTAGLIVQYGFAIIGRNGNPANEAALGSVVIGVASASSITINFDAADAWIGYMNVFELPANGGGYQFGSSWGLADLKSTADTVINSLTLQPNFNTYADNPGDTYWIDTANQVGNKQMEANIFVESDSSFNGQDLTFTGDVAAYTLDSNYEAKFFIKALDPNNGFQDAFAGAKTFDIPMSGTFTVSALASELTAGLIVQYGFSIIGRNANPANEAALGSVVIGNLATSVTPLSQRTEILVFPNPADQLLNIQSDINFNSYRIFSTLGQVVKVGAYNTSIDISSLPSGTYHLECFSEDKRAIQTFIRR